MLRKLLPVLLSLAAFIGGAAGGEMLRRPAAPAEAAAGAPVEGVCLYPVVNHPGWDDDRHCHNGLWDYPDARGERPADPESQANTP